jgi:spore germination protein YaaH
MPGKRLLLVAAALAAAGAGGALVASGRLQAAAPPTFLLEGVALRSGDREIPPHPSFTAHFNPGLQPADLVARVDGRPVQIEARPAGVSLLLLPALSQGSWHRLVLTRGVFGRRVEISRVDFRTTDPLRAYVAWSNTVHGMRADVGFSAPPTSDEPVAAALRQAGAVVDRGDATLIAHWAHATPGTDLAFTIPAGLQAASGAYLEKEMAAKSSVPHGTYTRVQVSDLAQGRGDGLSLQVYYVPTRASKVDLGQHARQINILSPAFYSLAADGTLNGRVDAEVLRIAHAGGEEIQPLVSNQDFDTAGGHQVIANLAGIDHVAAQLIAEAKAQGYSGYQLDFENLSMSDRDVLTRFSDGLGMRLHAAGLKYSAAVIPRKGGGPVTAADRLILQSWSGVYDFGALSRSSDWLTLMAYEQHTQQTGPGPVAAIDWVGQISRASAAGIDPSRIYLGVPFYYRDWTAGQAPTAGDYLSAAQYAYDGDTGLSWNFDAASAYMHYRSGSEDHLIWMEDYASLSAKLAVAHELKAAGVSTWRLALEDPAWWTLWPTR